MLQVQATEAKARLAELLRTVERGETVVITRHGKKIAHIVPAPEQERAKRRAAVQALREARKNWKPTGMTREEILALPHEGHRY